MNLNHNIVHTTEGIFYLETAISPEKTVANLLQLRTPKFLHLLAILEFNQAAFEINPEHNLTKPMLTFWDNVSSPFLLLINCERLYNTMKFDDSQGKKLEEMYHQVIMDLNILIKLLALSYSNKLTGTSQDEMPDDQHNQIAEEVVLMLKGIITYSENRCTMITSYRKLAIWEAKPVLQSVFSTQMLKIAFWNFEDLVHSLKQVRFSLEHFLNQPELNLLKKKMKWELHCMISAVEGYDALNYFRFSDTISSLISFKSSLQQWTSFIHKEDVIVQQASASARDVIVRPTYKWFNYVYHSIVDKLPLFFQQIAYNTSTGGAKFLKTIQAKCKVNYHDIIKEFTEHEELQGMDVSVTLAAKNCRPENQNIEKKWTEIFFYNSMLKSDKRELSYKEVWELQKIGGITGSEDGWGSTPYSILQNMATNKSISDESLEIPLIRAQSNPVGRKELTPNDVLLATRSSNCSPFSMRPRCRTSPTHSRSSSAGIKSSATDKATWADLPNVQSNVMQPRVSNYWPAVVQALEGPSTEVSTGIRYSSVGPDNMFFAQVTPAIYMVVTLKGKKKNVDKVLQDFLAKILGLLQRY